MLTATACSAPSAASSATAAACSATATASACSAPSAASSGGSSSGSGYNSGKRHGKELSMLCQGDGPHVNLLLGQGRQQVLMGSMTLKVYSRCTCLLQQNTADCLQANLQAARQAAVCWQAYLRCVLPPAAAPPLQQLKQPTHECGQGRVWCMQDDPEQRTGVLLVSRRPLLSLLQPAGRCKGVLQHIVVVGSIMAAAEGAFPDKQEALVQSSCSLAVAHHLPWPSGAAVAAAGAAAVAAGAGGKRPAGWHGRACPGTRPLGVPS